MFLFFFQNETIAVSYLLLIVLISKVFIIPPSHVFLSSRVIGDEFVQTNWSSCSLFICGLRSLITISFLKNREIFKRF